MSTNPRSNTDSTILDSYSGPPDYRTQGRHGITPEMTHDEIERFNYLTHVTRFIGGHLRPGALASYEAQVEPAFVKKHGRKPANRHEARKAMLEDNAFRNYSAVRRANMEQRQQAGLWLTLRQSEELAARAADIIDGDENLLQVDPSLEIPRYVTDVHHHCMPGSFYAERLEGDVTNGANYDSGFFVTIGGAPDPWLTGNGEGLARTIKALAPDFKPKRILDIGVTIGHGTIPLARAFPDAEVIAVDVGAPVLRYGAARARSMGVENIQFVQADGADLSRYEDGSFDLIVSIILMHEISFPTLRAIHAETHRLLRPGGIVTHIDISRYTDAVPVQEQAMRDWDAFYNNEPFWTTFRDLDVFDYMAAAGFAEDSFFHSAPAYNHRADREDTPILIGKGRIPAEASVRPDKHLWGARK
jgi:SAM-dependent methyltransferase